MARLHVGAPTEAGPLTVFPVWTDAISATRGYRLGPTASSVVREMPRSPRVDALAMTNTGALSTLLTEGTVLEGGWQHRVVTRDVLVPPGATRVIPVVCIEQGRWGGGSRHHGRGMLAPLAVRGALRGIRLGQRDRNLGNQGDVWRRVDGYQRRHGWSATSSLVDVQRRAAPRVDDVRPLAGQRGVLVGIGGHPVLLEVFDSSRTLAQRLTAILASVALDAWDVPRETVSAAKARAFVQHVQQMYPTAGSPLLAANDDALVSVRSLHRPGRTVHLAALNARHHLVLAA